MYTKKLYFSGGSFYELQEVFDHIPGVQETRAGCINAEEKPGVLRTGETEKREVMGIEIIYNPKKMDISQLIDILFAVVDPALPQGQGEAVGPLYRSGVYYTDREDEPQIEYHMNFIRNRGRQAAVTAAGLTLNDTNSRPQRRCYAKAMRLKDFQPVEPEHQHYLQKHPHKETYIDFVYLKELGILS